MHRLNAADPGFAQSYRALLADRGRAVDAAEETARAIIAEVKAGKLFDVIARLDGVRPQDGIRVPEQHINAAFAACPADLIAALELAAARIAAFHERAKPADARWTDEAGVSLGWRWTPVDAAGLYAPGGLAAYPSSVLMNAIPARIAGVERLVMATPPQRLTENPAILAAAKIAGISEVWGVGGAQAIAALAYGGQGLAPVDVIVGPGNSYVAAAKKLVFGDVGVDSVAGPSEVFILADSSADPVQIAWDLLAQAEHDADAQSVLMTDDPALADAVAAAVTRLTPQAGPSAAASLQAHGAIIVLAELAQGCALIDEAAPEHLEIIARDGEALAAQIRHAGAIFIGADTPEAFGDYLAGPNHVLPTGRRARYASGLSTLNFMKRTTLISASPSAIQKLGPAAARIAEAEGLPAHAGSLHNRLKS